jgi:hypothetical protein
MKIELRDKTGDKTEEQYNQFDSFDALWSDAYKRVEDISPEVFSDEKNGLQRLPKVVRFQILSVLAIMWAFIFAIITAEFIHFGINVTTSIIAHILVIGGIIFTRSRLNRIDGYNGRGTGGEHE